MGTTPPPRTVGRYQILNRIGQGGMGTLYLAFDPMLERQVAIKLLHEAGDDEVRSRFTREARSAARLRHPNIVTIFDVGEDGGQPFLAMEYIQGQTLAEVIRDAVPLALARKLRVIEDVCAGLGFAHKAGIVHRDIKPANLMLDGDGALKILDFGIARVAESGMTQAGMLIGTLNYMSPEQVMGLVVDGRSDLFAVGAVMYELLSRRQAFPGSLVQGILHKIIQEAPEPLESVCPGLPGDVIRIVNRSLEKNLGDRYSDLGAMRNDIQRIRQRLEIDGEPVDTPGTESDPTALVGRPLQLPTARRGGRDELVRRRGAQIEEYWTQARQAFDAGELERAIASCEQVLMLDPEDQRAEALLDRARVAIDQQRAREWMDEARDLLQRDDISGASSLVDQVLTITPESNSALELRRLVDEARLAAGLPELPAAWGRAEPVVAVPASVPKAPTDRQAVGSAREESPHRPHTDRPALHVQSSAGSLPVTPSPAAVHEHTTKRRIPLLAGSAIVIVAVLLTIFALGRNREARDGSETPVPDAQAASNGAAAAPVASPPVTEGLVASDAPAAAPAADQPADAPAPTTPPPADNNPLPIPAPADERAPTPPPPADERAPASPPPANERASTPPPPADRRAPPPAVRNPVRERVTTRPPAQVVAPNPPAIARPAQDVDDARAGAARARRDAVSAGSAAVNSAFYLAAVTQLQEADRLLSAGQTDEGARALWSAAALFTAAAATRAPAAPTPAIPSPVVTTPSGSSPTAPASTPTVNAAPPASSPPSPPAAATRPPDEEAAIRAVVQAYARAYAALDAEAVRRVFPTVNVEGLRRAFSQMRDQQVAIEDLQISVDGSAATVNCVVRQSFTPRVGRREGERSLRIQLGLQKSDGRWLIVGRR